MSYSLDPDPSPGPNFRLTPGSPVLLSGHPSHLSSISERIDAATLLERIRGAIRNATFDMTVHAAEEMAEEGLDITDAETALHNGRLIKTETDDPRGRRYTVHGIGTDGITPVGIVGRFTGTGRYLIITIYEVREREV